MPDLAPRQGSVSTTTATPSDPPSQSPPIRPRRSLSGQPAPLPWSPRHRQPDRASVEHDRLRSRHAPRSETDPEPDAAVIVKPRGRRASIPPSHNHSARRSAPSLRGASARSLHAQACVKESQQCRATRRRPTWHLGTAMPQRRPRRPRIPVAIASNQTATIAVTTAAATSPLSPLRERRHRGCILGKEGAGARTIPASTSWRFGRPSTAGRPTSSAPAPPGGSAASLRRPVGTRHSHPRRNSRPHQCFLALAGTKQLDSGS